MEGYEKNDGMEMNDRDEIYSKPVRAGKRTYFFDVKATRNNDYYLTITESKKKLEKDGSQNYEKHKIFLYKEDFDKFAEGLDNAVAYIKAGYRLPIGLFICRLKIDTPKKSVPLFGIQFRRRKTDIQRQSRNGRAENKHYADKRGCRAAQKSAEFMYHSDAPRNQYTLSRRRKRLLTG